MYALEYTSTPEIITALLKAGADVKAQDKDGKTPLMYAASKYNNLVEVMFKSAKKNS